MTPKPVQPCENPGCDRPADVRWIAKGRPHWRFTAAGGLSRCCGSCARSYYRTRALPDRLCRSKNGGQAPAWDSQNVLGRIERQLSLMPQELVAELSEAADCTGIDVRQLWYEACKLYGVRPGASANQLAVVARKYLED